MTTVRHSQLIAALAAALMALVAAASAQAESWNYRADLGGWLDNETGLVWGPCSHDYTGSLYTWNGAMTSGLNLYRQLSGISAWRLPTLAEVETAHSHNAFAYLRQTNYFPELPQGYTFWTSLQTKNKKSAYRIDWRTGITSLVGTGSGIQMMPVYRP